MHLRQFEIKDSLKQNLITTQSLNTSQLEQILTLASSGKANAWAEYRTALSGKCIGLLFLNPSLRTRASFQVGIAKLGGTAIVLNSGSECWALEHRINTLMDADKAEHVCEAAGVLSRYFDALGVRSFADMRSWEEDSKDSVLSAFANYVNIPLINLESSLWHPCQALADALTLRERFGDDLKNKKFVLSWAPHPKQLPMAVPNSALLVAAQLGMNVTLACPENYSLAPEILDLVTTQTMQHNAKFSICHSQEEAFAGADVIYAKSWSPAYYLGRPQAEKEQRQNLQHWTIGAEKMALTNQANFMHCLPVRRNVVVTDQVLDNKKSLIFEQAENRIHAQNAWLVTLFSNHQGGTHATH